MLCKLTCSTAKGASLAIVMIVNHTLPREQVYIKCLRAAGKNNEIELWEKRLVSLLNGETFGASPERAKPPAVKDPCICMRALTYPPDRVA